MNFFVLALCFYLVTIPDLYYAFFLFVFLILFLWIRFHQKKLLFLFLSLFLLNSVSKLPPPALDLSKDFSVVTIKKGYALASNRSGTIVLYEPEKLHYQDQIRVHSSRAIESLGNFTLFSFEKHMASQRIYEQADDYTILAQKDSIKNRLYDHFKSKNDPFFMSALYGIHEKESMIANLGVPVLALLNMVRSTIKKRWNPRKAQWITLVLAVWYGSLFVLSSSLIRYILHTFGKLLFDDWKHQFSFFVIVYLLMIPYGSLDLCLVFPMLSILLYRTGNQVWQLWINTLLQAFYFRSIDFFQLLFFSFLRKIYGLLLIGKLLVPFSLHVELPSWQWKVYPNVLIFALFLFWLFHWCIGKKRHQIQLALIITVSLLFAPYISPFFHVFAINIGQGDCFLLVEPFNRSATMIDCGQNLYRDNIEEIVFPFLEDRGISKLDLLLLTHDDFDHSGGLESLQNKIEIEQIITDSSQKLPYPFMQNLLIDRVAEDENETSLITYIQYDGFRYLFMGDASANIEQQLMDQYTSIPCDVLKVGHHGSNTSSSKRFIDWIVPKFSIISVGNDNRYHHPSPEVIANLNDVSSIILQTQDVGALHFMTWKNHLFLETDAGYYGYQYNGDT